MRSRCYISEKTIFFFFLNAAKVNKILTKKKKNLNSYLSNLKATAFDTWTLPHRLMDKSHGRMHVHIILPTGYVIVTT